MIIWAAPHIPSFHFRALTACNTEKLLRLCVCDDFDPKFEVWFLKNLWDCTDLKNQHIAHLWKSICMNNLT